MSEVVAEVIGLKLFRNNKFHIIILFHFESLSHSKNINYRVTEHTFQLAFPSRHMELQKQICPFNSPPISVGRLLKHWPLPFSNDARTLWLNGNLVFLNNTKTDFNDFDNYIKQPPYWMAKYLIIYLYCHLVFFHFYNFAKLTKT